MDNYQQKEARFVSRLLNFATSYKKLAYINRGDKKAEKTTQKTKFSTLWIVLCLCFTQLLVFKGALASVAFLAETEKTVQAPRKVEEINTKEITAKEAALESLSYVGSAQLSLTPEKRKTSKKRRSNKKRTLRRKKSSLIFDEPSEEFSNFSGPQTISRVDREKVPSGIWTEAIVTEKASNGFIRAKLTKSLRFKSTVYLKAGSILTGMASSQGGRLKASFDSALGPNGESLKLRAIAIDSRDKLAGIRGKKLGKKALKFLSMTGLNFLGTMSKAMAKKDSHGLYNPEITVQPTVEDAALYAGGEAALDLSEEVLKDLQRGVEVVVVPENTKIRILIVGSGN